jgi:predicted MFS family arabinose efflux permease
MAVEARRAAPMLPLGLFRIRDFAAANLLTLLLYAALGGALFFVPLNLIEVQGYSATSAGAALLPFVLILFVLSRWSGRLVDRVGPKLPLVGGPLIAAFGFALFARPGAGAGYATGFLPAIVVLALGMAIVIAPLTTTVMNSVGPEMAGIASGVNNAVSRTAALLAIAGFGLLMAWAFDATLQSSLAPLNLPEKLLAALRAGRGKFDAASLPAGTASATAAAIADAVAIAFVSGFRWVMLTAAALAVASGLSAALMIGGERPSLKARVVSRGNATGPGSSS